MSAVGEESRGAGKQVRYKRPRSPLGVRLPMTDN